MRLYTLFFLLSVLDLLISIPFYIYDLFKQLFFVLIFRRKNWLCTISFIAIVTSNYMTLWSWSRIRSQQCFDTILCVAFNGYYNVKSILVYALWYGWPLFLREKSNWKINEMRGTRDMKFYCISLPVMEYMVIIPDAIDYFSNSNKIINIDNNMEN